MPEVNGTAGAEVAADTEAPAMPAIPPGPDPAVKAKEVRGNPGTGTMWIHVA